MVDSKRNKENVAPVPRHAPEVEMEADEVQKPIFFKPPSAKTDTSCGELNIPELKDEDCIVIRQHENSIDSISKNPVNANEFLTGSHDKTARLWDAEKAKVVKVFKGNEQGIWNLNYT